ncbi:MAG: PAS domain S-box protein [Candidatus Aminicenantales bacterium]
MAKVRILIVEDEILVAKDIEKILKSMHHEVVGISSSGAEALEITRAKSPDLVFMDIALKGRLDGVQVAEKIRQDFNIPVIYLTALTNEQTLQRAKITEPYGYIFKPFESKELHAAIEMALYKHKMEEAYQTLVNNSLQGLTIIQEGRIVFANPIVCQITGYAFEELRSLSQQELRRLILPEDVEKIWNDFQSLSKRKPAPSQYQFRFICKNGKIRWAESLATLIKYQGSPALQVTHIDITKRKQAEEVLRQNEERFYLLFEKAPLGYQSLDKEGRLIAVNQVWLETLKYKREEVLGQLFSDFMTPQSQETFQKKFSQIKALGEGHDLELELVRKNGSRLVASLHGNVTYDDHGEFRQTHCILTDITERKKIEEKIKSSETRFRELFNHMRSAVAVFDAVHNGEDFLFKDFNRAGEKIEKVRKKDILGKSVRKVFPGVMETGLFNVFQRVWKTGKPEHFPAFFYEDKRIAGWRENFIYKLPLGEIVSVSDDVTEKKLAEENLKISREELHRLALHLQSAREQERTHIAHELHDELGQALTALKMDISWILKKLPAREEILIEKTISVSQLIDSTIKTVQRLSTEMRPGVLDDLGLAAAIEWQAEEFKNRTGIPCKFTPGLEDIALDKEFATAIFRIFQEALTNIARHARATKAKVSFYEKDGLLILQVQDNGKGITKKEISNPYSIGLIGMRERAHALGGQIEIQGRKNKGATVTLTVPISRKGHGR